MLGEAVCGPSGPEQHQVITDMNIPSQHQDFPAVYYKALMHTVMENLGGSAKGYRAMLFSVPTSNLGPRPFWLK